MLKWRYETWRIDLVKSETTPKKIAIGILLTGLMVLGNGVFRGSQSVQDFFELRNNKQTMQSTVGSLKKQNETLRSEIHKLKTSPDYARKVLRDKYHVTEPGERIIFFSE
jgi:cell division protein FtsB